MQGIAGDARASTPGLAPPALGEGEGGSAAGLADGGCHFDGSGYYRIGNQHYAAYVLYPAGCRTTYRRRRCNGRYGSVAEELQKHRR